MEAAQESFSENKRYIQVFSFKGGQAKIIYQDSASLVENIYHLVRNQILGEESLWLEFLRNQILYFLGSAVYAREGEENLLEDKEETAKWLEKFDDAAHRLFFIWLYLEKKTSSPKAPGILVFRMPKGAEVARQTKYEIVADVSGRKKALKITRIQRAAQPIAYYLDPDQLSACKTAKNLFSETKWGDNPLDLLPQPCGAALKKEAESFRAYLQKIEQELETQTDTALIDFGS